jgi:adenine C2-methylase RlmN of 23S rRNA A2503 and tRNA A37
LPDNYRQLKYLNKLKSFQQSYAKRIKGSYNFLILFALIILLIRLSNVVMMGMGEPLANYDNVMEAIRRMHNELGIGARHITISTVGLAPRIR